MYREKLFSQNEIRMFISEQEIRNEPSSARRIVYERTREHAIRDLDYEDESHGRKPIQRR